MRTLFLDLDGPLLDVSPRYVALHQALCAQRGWRALEGEQYWALKRARQPERRILALVTQEDVEPYLEQWRACIEDDAWLAHDVLQPGVLGLLDALRGGGRWRLVLATLRARREGLERQLERLGLARRLDAVLQAPHTPGDEQAKARLLAQVPTPWLEGGAIVGDTEVDVLAGRAHGLRTYAVSCGIRDAEHLRGAEPEHLVPDLAAALRTLEEP